MKKNRLYSRITSLTVLIFLSSICAEILCNDLTLYNYEIDIQCYSVDLSAYFTAVGVDVSDDDEDSRYQFEFEEMSGDLAIDEFECEPDGRDWYTDGDMYYCIEPYDEEKRITLDFSVLKNDIQPGESRNFRLKYRQKDHRNDNWNSYQYSQQFTVSVEDVPVSGTAGTLCNSSRTYSISAPTGYSTTWSFSNSNLVTSSSGSGTSAS